MENPVLEEFTCITEYEGGIEISLENCFLKKSFTCPILSSISSAVSIRCPGDIYNCRQINYFQYIRVFEHGLADQSLSGSRCQQ
jgi:hypothetical protein